jgi:hypothetical protein
MLYVLETVQDIGVGVMLARETFDPKMASIKVWLAGMGLDSMKERMSMGVKAWLRAGKANTDQDRYGYRRNGEVIEIVSEEAKWVQKIFEWYIDRTLLNEIRRRLIAADAPKKGSTVPRRIRWARSSVQAVLKAAESYARGVKVQTRDGEAFEISVPPIISLETYWQYLEVRQANKTYPARHLKQQFLAGGLLHC